MSYPLTITFSNAEARRQFSNWLEEQGEQNYWEWMRFREVEEDGPITAINFRYTEDKIDTTCSRLDWEDENGLEASEVFSSHR